MTVLSAPCSPSNLSSVTLVGSSPSDTNEGETAVASPHHSPKKPTSPKKEPSPTKEPPPRVETHQKPSIKHETTEKKVERAISEDTEGE